MFFLLQRTISEIQIESLRKQLSEAISVHSKESVGSGSLNVDKNGNLRESDAILVIKRLQEQVLFCFPFTHFFLSVIALLPIFIGLKYHFFVLAS